jgi:hypothetical protein
MSYHPRIECKDVASFLTTRARKSELWLVNNRDLEEAILGYAARYATRYEVKLYALAMEGNHIQKTAEFPNANRAFYMRDFNSAVARAVPRYQPDHPGGPVWERRYSAEYIVENLDIEDRFFYTVLQAVNDGLVDDIRDYPGYNCFEDAITGTERQYKVVRWKEYNDAKRWKKNVCIDDFTELHTLKYERIPGYEKLSQIEYASMMRRKLKKRTAAIIRARKGKPSVGAARLKEVKPGARPKKTKKSGPRDHRPRVHAKCPKSRSRGLDWYFLIYFEYKECSKRYRAGEEGVVFPAGTYKPPLFTVARCGPIS